MKKLWFLTTLAQSIIAVLVSVIFEIPIAAAEPSAVLTWEPPTNRVDGTPLAQGEIPEYRVYHTVDDPAGIIAGQNYVSVTSGSATTFDLQLTPRLEMYTVYFAVSAVDSGGRESDLTDTMLLKFYVRSTAKPAAPTSVNIGIRCGDTCTVRLADDP